MLSKVRSSGIGLRVSVVVWVVALVAGACAGQQVAEPSSTASVVSTSSTASVVSTSILPTSTAVSTTLAPADAGLVFETAGGVATAWRQLTQADEGEFEFERVVEAPRGAEFTLISCVTTWPNRWEVSGTWTPSEDAAGGETEWVLGIGLVFGDVTGGGAAASVTMKEPGEFTVPLLFDPFDPDFRRVDRASHEYRGERAFGPGPSCTLFVAGGPQPVADMRSPAIESTARFEGPVSRHEIGSLQAELEAMTDPGEHWLGALSWHIGLEGSLPVDVMYLRPGVKIDWLQLTEESTCVGVQIVYVDDVVTGQAAGCPPAAEPLDRFGENDLFETEDGWVLGTIGVEAAELIAMRWQGAEPVPRLFDTASYLANLDLADGDSVVATFAFGDGSVALVERQGDPIQYYPLELFTGGGAGYIGGGPGETWQGCSRVDYSGAGYAIVLTEDPTWAVTHRHVPVEMVPAGDIAAGIIRDQFRAPPQVDIDADPDSGCR